MRSILFVLMAFVCLTGSGKTALQYARQLETAIEGESGDFPFVKKWTDEAITHALERAGVELRKKGFESFADDLSVTWQTVYGKSLFASARDIGDHKPASQWLQEKYDTLEFLIGKEICRATHISDIKTLNHGVPVVIKPGSFPMDSVAGERIDEYRRHFAGGPSGGDFYYGVIPVVAYWSTLVTCVAAGVPYVCGPVASLTQRLIDIVAAQASDTVFNRFN